MFIFIYNYFDKGEIVEKILYKEEKMTKNYKIIWKIVDIIQIMLWILKDIALFFL